MTISKGKPGSSIMVAGWIIDDRVGSRSQRIITAHVDCKPTIVDAVFTFIQEYPGFGWAWIKHGTVFKKILVTAGICVTPAQLPDIAVHVNAADARRSLLATAEAFIRRTLIDTDRRAVAA